MANPKNNVYTIPLNGELNFSKLKTSVTQFAGFNDCNSPIYGDTLTPFWKKTVDKGTVVRNRPYIENGILKDKNGQFLMDVSNYKGVVKESFSSSDSTVSFLDDTHYIEQKNGVTTLVAGDNRKDIEGLVRKAEYKETSTGVYEILIIQENSLSIYNKDTLELKASTTFDGRYERALVYYSNTYKETLISVFSEVNSLRLQWMYGLSAVYEDELKPDNDPPLPHRIVGFNLGTGDRYSTLKPLKTWYPVSGDTSSVSRTYLYKDGALRELSLSQGTYDPKTYLDGILVFNNSGYLAGRSDEDTFTLGFTYSDISVLTGREYYYFLPDWETNVETMPYSAAKINYVVKYKGNGVFEPVSTIDYKELITYNNPGHSHSVEYRTIMANVDTVNAQIMSIQLSAYEVGDKYTLAINGKDYSTTTLLPKTEVADLVQYKTDNGCYFRQIVNAGLVQSIAVASGENKVGTLCETLGSVDVDSEITVSGNSITYKSSQGDWKKLTVVDTIDSSFLTFVDDYVIIKTVEQANCINTKTRKVYHFSSDWNNRWTTVDNGATPFSLSGIEKPLLGSAINARFETSNSSVIGFISPFLTLGSGNNNIYPIAAESEYDVIEIYVADASVGEVIPKYKTSLSNNAYSVEARLVGLTYPSLVNIPSLFSEYIESAFNQVFVKDGTESFSLIVYDTKLYFGYSAESYLDNVKNIFTIQGATFAETTSGHIYSVSTVDGVSSLDSVVVDIEGLIYCGCIPSMAIFFSPMDRTLKSFTADRDLKNLTQATEIDYIYYVKYNPQTFAMYLATNNGLYVYSQFNQYRLPINNITGIAFEGKHIYIEHDKIVEDYLYEYEEGCEKVPVHFTTRYYGAGKNQETITDCIYFRLYNEVPSSCYIKLKTSTITDGVYNTEEKEIHIPKDLWDEDTHTCYVRYQPKYQKSVGLSLDVVTDCSISEINFSSSLPVSVANSKAGLDI